MNRITYSAVLLWLISVHLSGAAFSANHQKTDAGPRSTKEARAGAGLCSHEFYVGLTDIVYNAEARRFEITLKVFTDDLELGLADAFNLSEVVLGDYGGSTEEDSLIFGYTLRKFSFSRKGGEAIPLHPVGRETELDVTWIYLETAEMQPLREAVVSNTMMMEIYRDQSHIIHLKQGASTKTVLLHRGKKSGILKP